MVRLLRHGHPFPSPAGGRAPAAAQGGSAAASPAPAVHADEVEHDAEVAGEHREDEEQQQRGVELQVHRAPVPDEAPGPGAVLDVLPVVQQGQRAEEQGDGVDGGQHGHAAAALDVALVEVGVPDGQVALQGHGEEHEHRGQAEEGHGEGEVVARAALGRQGHQGLVPRVRSQHHGADETGAQQVGEHQLGHQHVEQGDEVPAAGTAPRVSPPAARQQRQRDEVPQHPGREHHGADGRALARGEPLASLAVLGPGVIGGIAHGEVPGAETCPPLPAGTWDWAKEEGLDAGALRDPEGKREGSKARAPFRRPARTEGRLGPGRPQLPQRPLGCSIRPVLEAPPTRAHRALRARRGREEGGRLLLGAARGRAGCGVTRVPVPVPAPANRPEPHGAPAGSGWERGPGTGRARRWAGARGLRASGSCLRPAGAVLPGSLVLD